MNVNPGTGLEERYPLRSPDRCRCFEQQGTVALLECWSPCQISWLQRCVALLECQSSGRLEKPERGRLRRPVALLECQSSGRLEKPERGRLRRPVALLECQSSGRLEKPERGRLRRPVALLECWSLKRRLKKPKWQASPPERGLVDLVGCQKRLERWVLERLEVLERQVALQEC
jgi:hypothetical protein